MGRGGVARGRGHDRHDLGGGVAGPRGRRHRAGAGVLAQPLDRAAQRPGAWPVGRRGRQGGLQHGDEPAGDAGEVGVAAAHPVEHDVHRAAAERRAPGGGEGEVAAQPHQSVASVTGAPSTTSGDR